MVSPTGAISTVVVAGPENQAFFPGLEKLRSSNSPKACETDLDAGGKKRNEQLEALTGQVTLIPIKTYLEKERQPSSITRAFARL